MRLFLIVFFLLLPLVAEEIILLRFENSTCPLSRAGAKEVSELHKKYQFGETRIETPLYPTDEGVKEIMDGLSKVRDYKVKTVPTYILLHGGKVIYRGGIYGPISERGKPGAPLLEAALRAASEGKNPAVVLSRPAGCAVPDWVHSQH